MKEEDLKKLFEKLEGSFDFEEPTLGHEERFLEKLNTSKDTVASSERGTSWWKMLSIAASIALLCVLGINFYTNSTSTTAEQVAEISPEVSQTEFYFASLINEQLQKLEGESTAETKMIVDDAMLQLKRLEANYKDLEQDLLNGGDNKLILRAMINNFQTRVDLLEGVLEQIETFKNLKDYSNENNII